MQARSDSDIALRDASNVQNLGKGNNNAGTVEAQELDSPSSQLQVPDGGTKAYMTILGGWIVMFCTFGYASSFGVYQDYFTLQGAYNPSSISWIGSFQLFLMFAMGLPSGKLFDLGYFHHIQMGGMVIYAFCFFMLSLTDVKSYYQIFLSQGVGVGIGSGLIFVPAMSVQAHHWRKHRAFAMGIVLTGSSVGGIIYPILLNRLINGKVGFSWGVRASAFLTLGLLIIANISMTTRLPPSKALEGAERPSLRNILTDVPYMIACFGTFLILWGLFFPYFYLQLYATMHHISSTLAFYMLSIMNAASVVGRILPNMISDRIGQFNVLIPITFCASILVFIMLVSVSAPGLIVFSILYGFFSGAFISLVPPTIAILSKNVTEIGIRMGLSFFLVSFANLTGTPVSGALLSSNFLWYKPVVFAGVCIFLGGCFICISRYFVAQRLQSSRV